MIKILSLLLLFLLSACGGKISLDDCIIGSVYAGGMLICKEPSKYANDFQLNLYEIERHTEEVEELSRTFYPDKIIGKSLEDNLREKGTRLVFTSKTLVRDCEKIKNTDIMACHDHLGGFNGENEVIYVMQTECVSAGSLAHELLHSIEFFYFGGTKGDHEREGMFMRPKRQLSPSFFVSLEWLLFDKLYREFCL